MLRFPPPLSPGARVALLAPAGPLTDASDLERAEANTREMGWEPVAMPHVLQRSGYLAGADADRLSDLNDALRDEHIDALWCVRGGYGVMRTLDRIDFAAMQARPKALIGFSDITALHHAFAARAGVSGLHGPCARGGLSPFSRDSLARAATRRDSCGVAANARLLRAGVARGPLVGGNLALLTSLCGTPYLFVPEGAILVVEDVHEPVYRLDRMLQQLRLGGVLARCSALLFGSFTERNHHGSEDNGDALLEQLLRDVAHEVNGPVLSGIPVGHIDAQWSWAFGAIAELNGDQRRVTLVNSTDQ